MTRRFILSFRMAPGDVSLLTALVRDLKYTYGDQYEVDVRTNFPGMWRYNPYLTPIKDGTPGACPVRLSYSDACREAQHGQRVHFVSAFHRDFKKKTGVNVPLLLPRPDLHLSDEEKRTPLVAGPYWVVMPGWKTDMTNKGWSAENWQEVIDRLRKWGLRFVQAGARKPHHVNPPMNNVLNLNGAADMRQLFVHIYHAEGVICGVSFPMHVAAAFEKPCVVIGGGREEPWWTAYDNASGFGPRAEPVRVEHRYLHTVSLLPCCRTKGCWKRRIVPLHDNQKSRDGKPYDKNLCSRPFRGKPQVVPTCMEMIKPDHVIEAVMSYYEDGTLVKP